MKFGLIANLKRSGAQEAIDFFIRWAEKSGNQLIFEENLSKLFHDKRTVKFIPRNELPKEIDILVSMGGDGTLLSSARVVGESGIPLLGINLGSLGFLTQLTPQQLLPALDAIIKSEYEIEKRMLIKAEVVGIDSTEPTYALNDIVIDNGPVSRMIDISLSVNDENIVTYKADGLIISTPTGSTAYSLAVGGPIMHPKMEAMIASPISAFSLTTRPMIFSADDRLEIRILTPDHPSQLTLDGQVMIPLKDNPNIIITKADYYSKFVVFPGNTFYKVLKSKLHWGYTPYT